MRLIRETQARVLSAVCTLALMITAGCATPTDWENADAEPLATPEAEGWREIAPERKPRSWTGGVSAVAAERPALPSAGLQLPRVSPDGRWVAFLDADEESLPVAAESWVSGRGLEPVSLWLRGVDADGLARNLAWGHAAWPTWSDDSSTLVFISHDPDTGCALAFHDVVSNQTQRLAVGLKKMLTPALSPDGRQVAVAGYGEIAEQALLFIVDLETGQARPGPPPALGGAQLMPAWLDRDTLIFVELDERGGGLMRWHTAEPLAEPVAPLRLPTSVFDAVHIHAGVPQPVSPDRRHFTYYSPQTDQMHWVDLQTGEPSDLRVADRAGIWWNDEWFLVAEPERLALVSPPQANDEADPPVSDERPRMNLLPGRWAPLWADPDQQSILLVGESDTPSRFRFLQLWVITK